MGVVAKLSSWSLLLLPHLLFGLCAQGSSGIGQRPEEINIIIRMVVDGTDGTDDVHIHTHERSAHDDQRHHSHMDHMDPSLMVFFTTSDLKMGKTMQIHFPKRDPSPPLLDKEKADSIPFSLKELPQILDLFSFSSSSPQAKAIEDTLKECETKPIKGETKTCVTSMESLKEFTLGAFGLNSHFRVLTTSHLTNSTTRFQNYTFMEMPKQIEAAQLVACHTMPYPYGVLYCHYQESETRVFEIPLVGENGDRVDAIAVCHMDTSRWGRSHPSFRVLRAEPGTIPVCHFFPADHFVLNAM